MKSGIRYFVLAAAACLAVVGFGVGFAPAARAVDVNDFRFKSFEADYYLSRDAAKRSHLRTEEKLVAVFPEYDQNHGILRAIPKVYDGHPVNLRVTAVTDGYGRQLNYSTYNENDNLVVKVGDADKYIHGEQTYRISYTQDDVTAGQESFDGFFWDVNGDQWQQSFDAVTARVHLEGDLAAAREAAHDRCFAGARGSTGQECVIGQEDSAVTVAADRALGAGETLTVELGFAKGTFAAYQMSTGEILALVGQWAVAAGAPALALIFSWTLWRRRGRDPLGRGAIVPEYLPPKGVSVLESSGILNERFVPKAISATIVDLAVRHYLRICEIEKSVLMIKSYSYELEIVRALQGLADEELEVVRALFGANESVGARVKLDDLKNKLYRRAAAIGKSASEKLVANGYFAVSPERAKWPLMTAGVVAIIGGFAAGGWVQSVLLAAGLVIAGMIFCIFAQFMPARTAKGVEIKEYLDGVRMYMQVAEAERMKILQSPHGKLTEKVDVGDGTQLVKLYERLLPYAVLFGIEKDWAEEMAPLYKEQPDWYTGATAFNAAHFAGAMSGLSAASVASFSAPSSSHGGGSAGGGGGGGGGGGW